MQVRAADQAPKLLLASHNALTDWGFVGAYMETVRVQPLAELCAKQLVEILLPGIQKNGSFRLAKACNKVPLTIDVAAAELKQRYYYDDNEVRSRPVTLPICTALHACARVISSWCLCAGGKVEC